MQGCCELPDRGERGVAYAGLDFPDVGASDPSDVGELLLCQAGIGPDQPESGTEGAQLSRFRFLTLHPFDARSREGRLRPPMSGV